MKVGYFSMPVRINYYLTLFCHGMRSRYKKKDTVEFDSSICIFK